MPVARSRRADGSPSGCTSPGSSLRFRLGPSGVADYCRSVLVLVLVESSSTLGNEYYNTFAYSDDPRTRARRLRAAFLAKGI